MFFRMKQLEMNTYLYAPKDDYKHRLCWRDKYVGEEAGMLLFLSAFKTIYPGLSENVNVYMHV